VQREALAAGEAPRLGARPEPVTVVKNIAASPPLRNLQDIFEFLVTGMPRK
jgi:hypothetical protein